MGAQRVTDARRSCHRHAAASQEGKVLGQTAGDRLQVVHGGNVAGGRTKGSPVDVEDVVVAVADVGCGCVNVC